MTWVRLFGVFSIFTLLQFGAFAQQKVKVLTTFLPLYCFTINITGDLADVQNLLPGSIDLHDYQLSPADLKKLNDAKLIVANGLGMETFLERALRELRPGKTVIYASDGLSTELIQDAAGNVNPHIWLDPNLAIRTVSQILNALEKVDPAHAATYRQNAERYMNLLRQMDLEIATQLKEVQGSAFITQHHAFEYFARHYRLRLVGVVETVAEVNPTPRQLAALHRSIRVENVKALFVPPGVPGALERQIAKDAGIKLNHLDPLETGELAPASYESGMRKNARMLKEQLK